MATKRAIQRLIVGDDGRLKTILIDLATLEPVLDPTGYYVINSGEPEPEPVPDVDAPGVETEEPGDEPPQENPERASDSRAMIDRAARPDVAPQSSANPAARSRDVGTSIARQAIDNALETGPIGNATTRAKEENRHVDTDDGITDVPTPTARPSSTGFAGGMANKPSTPETSTRNIDYSNIGANRPHKVADEHEGFLSDIARDVYGKDSKVSVTSGDVNPDDEGWTADGGKYSKSHRHTDELGADVQFSNPHTGTVETNTQRIGDLAMAAAARNKMAGVGFGEDYMGDRTMHIDQANKGGTWGGGFTKNQLDNIDFARETGIGPTPNYGAPTPTSRPNPQSMAGLGTNSITPSRFDFDEDDDKSIASQVVADAKDVSEDRVSAPRTGLAGASLKNLSDTVSRPSGLTVDTEKTRTGTTVTDDGYTTTERTGARGWRNNNPGNIRSSPFADKMGAIGNDFKNANGQFAVFGSMDEGRRAQASLLSTEKYQSLSIKDAIERYAPPKENDTARYVREITDALGLPAETKMSDLTSAQRETMVDAMAKVEGSTRPGRETKTQHTYSGKPFSRDIDAPSEKIGGKFGGSGLGYSARGGSDSPSESRGNSSGFASRSDRGSFGTSKSPGVGRSSLGSEKSSSSKSSRSERSTESSGGRGRGGFAAGGNSTRSERGSSESQGGRGRGGFAAGGNRSSSSGSKSSTGGRGRGGYSASSKSSGVKSDAHSSPGSKVDKNEKGW